jgi:hypothetical protein
VERHPSPDREAQIDAMMDGVKDEFTDEERQFLRELIGGWLDRRAAKRKRRGRGSRTTREL